MLFAISFNYTLATISLYVAKKYNLKINYWVSGFSAGLATTMVLKLLIER